MITNFLHAITAQNIEVLHDELLSRHTSFRIGGLARMMVVARTMDDVLIVLQAAREQVETVKILGGGSNILAPDEGYPGVILLPPSGDIRRVSDTVIEADCGVPKAALAVYACREGLAGLEFAHGIPGTVGGGVYMNAGAYGGDMSQVVISTTAVNSTGEVVVIDNAGHKFGNRTSMFKENPGLIILSTRLRLTHGDPRKIRARMDDLMTQRRDKQPLEYPSAGSVFKRPEGHFAGKLIEDSGLKGYTIGGAQVSEKHAGFIINRGGATAADVRCLIEHIQATVLRNYNIELECELEIW